MRTARLAALGLAAALAAGCSGGGGGSARSATPTGGAGAPAQGSGVPAVRWWSNSAARSGSPIDPKAPDALAATLHESRPEYCAMLRQTVGAGRSILPDVTASDPALLTSTKAFLAELEAVAPATVAGPWHALGGVVLAVVASAGDPAKMKGVGAAAVQKAAGTVAADAKSRCGVDLSSAVH